MLLRDNDVDPTALVARQTETISLVTAVSQTGKAFFLKRVVGPIQILLAQVFASAVAGAMTVRLWNSSGEEILLGTALAIDATPEKFKTLTKLVLLSNGIVVEKAATTAIVFSAAHVVTASKFGIVLVQVNKTTGAYSTKCPGATQTTAMAYNSAPLALAALPAPDAGCLKVGYIALAAKAATWTANTDDLTNGSDLTTATFTDGTAFQATPITSITPLALQNVAGTLATSKRIHNGRYLVATYTSDGTGALTNGVLTLDIRPDQMRGDPPPI